MSYRDPDEVASLRARVEHLEEQAERADERPEPGRDGSGWWPRLMAVTAIAFIVLVVLGGRTCVRDNAEASAERCRTICAIHGLEPAWIDGAGCGPSASTYCACARAGLDGGVMRRFRASNGRETP